MDWTEFRKYNETEDQYENRQIEVITDTIECLSREGHRPYFLALSLISIANTLVLKGEDNSAFASFGEYQINIGQLAKESAQRKGLRVIDGNEPNEKNSE